MANKSGNGRGRPVAYLTWGMAYVARELRKTMPDVEKKQAAETAIRLLCRLWKLDGEWTPHDPVKFYLGAVLKQLQKLENRKMKLSQFEALTEELDDAVVGAMLELQNQQR